MRCPLPARFVSTVLLAACCLGAATSCDMLRPKEKEAVYKFPPGKKVLVFVDVRPSLGAPPEFAMQLGQAISDQLYHNSGASVIVPQERLMQLKQDTAQFSQWGIADIARATGADDVLHVDLVGFNIAALSDESITEGAAQALVKVVDRNGNRLWPSTSTVGAAVEARIDPAFSENRDRAGVEKEIVDRMAVRIARAFFKYKVDDPAMAK